jgi:predicted DCC family thiol-disulfide oxidoreductase YuxK
MNASAERPGPVLLFDGACGLCNRVVRLLLRMDAGARLRFAPLQGAEAQGYLRVHGLPTENFDTLVYVPDWTRRERPEYLLRTAGVLAALREVGGCGRVMAGLLSAVPTSWRDAAYRGVGHWRYRVFGPWRPRPLPRPEWSARFLGRME